MDKLDNGKKYTFAQIAAKGFESFALEADFIGCRTHPVQLHHVNIEELLKIPEWANSIWEFKFTSTEGIPTFRIYEAQAISLLDILSIELDFDRPNDDYPLLIAPKLFPYLRKHLTLDQACIGKLNPPQQLVILDIYLSLYKYMYRLADALNLSKFHKVVSGSTANGRTSYMSANLQDGTSLHLMLPKDADYFGLDQFDISDREHLVIFRSFDQTHLGELTVGAAEKFDATQYKYAIEYIKQLLKREGFKFIKVFELRPDDYFSMYGKDYTVEEVDISEGLARIKVVDHKNDDESYTLCMDMSTQCVLLDRKTKCVLSVRECLFNIKQAQAAWQNHCVEHRLDDTSIPAFNKLFSLLDQ